MNSYLLSCKSRFGEFSQRTILIGHAFIYQGLTTVLN